MGAKVLRAGAHGCLYQGAHRKAGSGCSGCCSAVTPAWSLAEGEWEGGQEEGREGQLPGCSRLEPLHWEPWLLGSGLLLCLLSAWHELPCSEPLPKPSRNRGSQRTSWAAPGSRRRKGYETGSRLQGELCPL